jgi:hypothetical protein
MLPGSPLSVEPSVLLALALIVALTDITAPLLSTAFTIMPKLSPATIDADVLPSSKCIDESGTVIFSRNTVTLPLVAGLMKFWKQFSPYTTPWNRAVMLALPALRHDTLPPLTVITLVLLEVHVLSCVRL